jgi:RHS repeat-associated protein
MTRATTRIDLSRCRSALTLAGVALALGALPAAADPHPNTNAGVAVDQAFQMGNVDNINLFNGSLTVTIPLGISYPLNTDFSYHFTLVANSNPWDFWIINYGGGVPQLQESESQPSHCSNAGLGWRVSFGAVMFGFPFTPSGAVCTTIPAAGLEAAGAVYEAPDGSQHLFYATLHPNDPDDFYNGVQDSTANGGVENVLYTRDGSYLRLRRNGAASEIDFPDGKVHTFGADGRITQMRDPFNKQVNISYLSGSACTGAVAGESSCWQITDSEARTHWVYFRSDLPPYNDTPPYGALITRVVLAAFGGAQATYQFNYTVPAAFGRGCPMSDTNFGDVSAPLLASVTLPDGSSYAPVASGASGYILQPAGPGNCVEGSASLTHLTLPTLGSLGWQYQVYNFPISSTKVAYKVNNPGVATRTTYDASNNVVGTWTYAISADSTDQQAVTSVTDPLGNRSVRYFSIATDVGVFGPGPNAPDYGRPYTPLTTLPSNPNLFLSEQVFDAAGVLRRTEYTRIERDVISFGSGPPDATNNNGREAQHETVYDDGSQGGWSETSSDGVGHYRQVTTDGTFAGNNIRTEYHAFNPTLGTYSVNQPTNTYTGTWVAIPATTPWVLGTSTYQYAQENGVSELRSFCYDATTGFLLRQRAYVASATDPGTMSANDLIQQYVEGGGGNPTNEIYFGGDNSPVAPTSSNLCLQTLPASPEYEINEAYVSGVKYQSQYAGTTFYALQLGIDNSTGLPNYSLDTAGIRTNSTYDSMGRLVYVQPRDGAWTQYLYHPAASPTSLASLTVEKQQNGSSATILAENKYTFDGLGRMIEKDTLMPSGSFSAQTTAWNALNWKTAVSAQGTPNTNLTQYLNYDPFGRVGTIQPPDSTAHKVLMSYSGVQTTQRTVSVGTAWTGSAVAESLSTTTETYDRFGRLASVTEPSGASGANVTTSYTYDAGNRLTQATTPSAGTTQRRVWSYDHRGFLNFETHPETAPNYTGDGHHKDYSSYDSRGHYHRTIDGSNDLSFTYDAAERPKLIYNTAYGANCTPSPISTPTCVKQWTYDNVAAGALGRLYTAARYNHILYNGAANTDAWTYTYTYGVPDGQVTQRTLQHTLNGAASGNQESFAQSWTYTPLYKINTETYPNCASTFTACSGTTARTVQDVYTNGFLTSIPGYTTGTGIAYYPNGMVGSVSHANGVTSVYGLDPFSLNRPLWVTSAGPTGNLWYTGTYAYDGAGNITQIGHGYYTYDLASRLVGSQVETNAIDNSNPASNTLNSQNVTYDAFGNIQQFVTNSILEATPTSATANHLTSSTYDASGNLLTWNGDGQYTAAATYQYDELNKLKHYLNGAQEWFYMYDADDERVWSFQPPAGGASRFDRYTLRGLNGQVKRTFELSGYNWANAWSGTNLWEDLIYRDGLLLAGYYNSGMQRNMDLDHLGSPRMLTASGGGLAAYHVYFPYGLEATSPTQDTERSKFTGHERDLADPSSPADDLDYMHARHYSPISGRFLSIDPMGANPNLPQSWNRYGYALGDPEAYVDPTGLSDVPVTGMVITTCNGGELCGAETITVTTTGNYYTGVQGLGDLIQGDNASGGNDAVNALRLNDGRIEPTPGPIGFLILLLVGGAPALAEDVAEEATAGEINVLNRGLLHTVENHGIAAAGKSTFSAGENLVTLVKSATKLTPTLQANGRLQFVVDAGRAIGVDRNSGLPTSIYTVITDAARNLVTAFPGTPR